MKNKKISLILVIMLMFLIVVTPVKSYAEEKLQELETTEEYKKWLALSKEEQCKVIMPRPYATKLNVNELKNITTENKKALNLKSAVIPKSYNLNDDNVTIKIRNQKSTPECWAFAATTMLSTNIQKMGLASTFIEFSPRHMDYATSQTFSDTDLNETGYKRQIEEGGNSFFALSYLTSGKGPVLEEDMPHSENINPIEYNEIDKDIANYHLHDYEDIPSVYKKIVDGKLIYYNGLDSKNSYYCEYTDDDVKEYRDAIKTSIMQYGAITSLTHLWGNLFFNPNSAKMDSYYCYDDTINPNHAIVIVGWDDNYSKDNFDPDNKPIHDGAYIVANSHGTNNYNNGYMYVSYDDVFIEQAMYSITNTTNKDYDCIYQHDYLGWSSAVYSTSTNIFSATNVFERKQENSSNNEVEYLNEIGLYILEEMDVDIYLCTDLKFNSNEETYDFSDGTLVASGNKLTPGYHVIELKNPVKIPYGKFAIKVKYKSDEYGAVVPVERFCDNTAWETATANKGESYYCIDESSNSWFDLTDAYEKTNFCIKAFTTKESDILVESIDLNESSIEMFEGDTFQLVASVKPNNVQTKNLKWTVQEGSDIVSVDENGLITAFRTGNAVVKVEDTYSNVSSICNVNVIKKSIPVIGVTLDKKDITIREDETVVLNANIMPDNADNKSVIWSSSDETIVKVSNNGLITPMNIGNADIIVKTLEGNYTDRCTVTVIPKIINVTGISLNMSSCEIFEDDIIQLKAMVAPDNATDKTIKWYSLNSEVATVTDSGIVKGIKQGNTSIVVEAIDGQYKATCNVIVRENKKIENGIYEIQVFNNQVIEVENASMMSGGNVRLNYSENRTNQRVEVKKLDNNYYTLKFIHSGMFLDVANADTKNGTNVWQCRENGADAQQWVIKYVGNDYYNIISKCSNTYLTVANIALLNGANIEINEKKEDNTQKFKFNKIANMVGTKIISDGIYEIKVENEKNIEVIDESNISGANVQLGNSNNAKSQKVEVKYVGNGYYTFKFMHSGMLLDVANADISNGTNVWQCRENGADAQKWIIKDAGNGYYNIISKCSNTFLTVSSNGLENGANIEINNYKNDKTQKFILNKIVNESGVQTLINGIYEIEVENGKVLEVIKDSMISGGNVQLGESNNAKSQKVEVKYIENGYYTIKFMHSGMLLDVANADTKNGTNVWQCRENGTDAQKWIIRDAGNGYYNLISKSSNTYLTIKDGNLVNGSNVEINTNKQDNSQRFKFKKVVNITGTQEIIDGIYEMQVENGKVVEVVNDSTMSGGNVQLGENNNAKSQKVEIKHVGNGYYTIKFMHSGMLLDVANADTKNGTNVWQCRENGADAQKWIIKDAGNGYYNIISKCSNTYLTIKDGKLVNSSNIEINTYKQNNSQKFKLKKVVDIIGTQDISDGIYEIHVENGKVVEVVNDSTMSGGNVQLGENNNAKSQKVEIKHVGNGYYTIKFMHSGMLLDVANADTKNGTNVWQCRENGTDAQKWIIKDVGNGYYNIISKCSNTYLTIKGGNLVNGSNVEINLNKQENGQKFKFIKEDSIIGERTISNGIYEIETKNNKVMDVYNASKVSGANVQIYERNNGSCQRVEIKYIDNGYYTLKFIHSGMFLDVANADTKNGTNVWQCRENGSDAQKWIIKDAGNGYYNIISKCSNTYLTVENLNFANDTNIGINKKLNNDSQLFKLNKKYLLF